MSSSNNFYVTLASNASLDRYPNNNGGCYTVHLPEDLHIGADWEVGLAEISLKQDWSSFVKEDIWVRVDDPQEPKTNAATVWHNYLGNSNIQTKVADLLRNSYIKMKFETMKNKKSIQSQVYKHELPIISTYDNLEQILRSFGFSIKICIDKAYNYFKRNNEDIHFVNTKFIYNIDEKNKAQIQFQKIFSETNSTIVKEEIIYPTELVLSHGLGIFLELFLDKNIKIIIDKNEALKSKNKEIAFTLDTEKSTSQTLNDSEKQSIKLLYPRKDKFEYPWHSTPKAYNIGKAFYPENAEIFSSFDSFKSKVIEPLLKTAFKELKIENLKVSIENVDSENGGKNIQFTKLQISYKGLQPYRLELSPVLYSILGITRRQLSDSRFLIATGKTFENVVHNINLDKSEREQDLKRGIDSIWVYTDIIKNHIVGHSVAPLLRILNVKQNIPRGETRLISFTHPHYFPLSRYDISEINICLFNSYGSAHIPIGSDTTCTLHFRKQSIDPYQLMSIKYHTTHEDDENLRKRPRYGA